MKPMKIQARNESNMAFFSPVNTVISAPAGHYTASSFFSRLFPSLVFPALLFLGLALLALLPDKADAAENRPRAVLIVDGSGSMWGRIGKREKITILRKRLIDNIATLKGRADLGIMSYGHRRRRDCRDIEMIVPIGPVVPQTTIEAIKRLLPRGKTPISSALKMAAEQLEKTRPDNSGKQSSRIILIADGVENCRLDPCRTSSQLASRYPNLRIDVIGLAVSDRQAEQMACISRNTKGQFYKAANGPQLQEQITRVFASLLASDKGKPGPKTEKPKALPPGLYLSARLASNAPVLKKGIVWRIYNKQDQTKGGSAIPLQRSREATPFLKLPPGKYRIEARFKSLLAGKDINLAPDSARKAEIVFNAGILATSARLAKDTPELPGVIFSLYDASSGSSGPASIIAHKQGKQAVFHLPAGKYSLKAKIGEVGARQDFVLKAGERQNRTIILDAGRLGLAASLARGSPPLDAVQYAIYLRRPDKDIELLRTLDPTPDLVLPKGDYLVIAHHGEASSRAETNLSAGETKRLSLVLDAGILELSSGLKTDTNGQQMQITYTILATENNRPTTMKPSASGKLVEVEQPLPARSFRHSFILPAGLYRVEARFGNSNARAESLVSIKAGQTSRQKIVVNAGHVRLSLSLTREDPPLPGVFWSIHEQDKGEGDKVSDRAGRQIASASGISPRLTLATGNYVAIADYLGQSYRQAFSIENGDDKSIRLTLK